MRFVAIAVVLASAGLAQDWELGGSVGYGAYRSGTVIGGDGQPATAEILNRFTAGVVIGQEPYEYISGELRWTYQDGHAVLAAAGVREEMDGHSHAVTYDVLIHFRRRERRLRPFFAAGAGIKGYIANGPAPQFNLLPAVATLAERDEWKPVFDLGGGVKYRLTDHVQLRFDFRDYLTTFPKRQIVPATYSTARGIFQQFTPMLGVSYVF